MNKKTYFITGISTEVGKTIASAILVEALKADYWKPIQAGDLDNSDSHKIHNYISNDKELYNIFNSIYECIFKRDMEKGHIKNMTL